MNTHCFLQPAKSFRETSLIAETWKEMMINHLKCIGQGMSNNHWDRVTLICVTKLTIIGSDNGFAPGTCEAIIWTNTGILLVGPLGTNFRELLIEMHICSSFFRWTVSFVLFLALVIAFLELSQNTKRSNVQLMGTTAKFSAYRLMTMSSIVC